jgi:hypothetical protein
MELIKGVHSFKIHVNGKLSKHYFKLNNWYKFFIWDLFGESTSLTNQDHLNSYWFYYNSGHMFVSIYYLVFCLPLALTTINYLKHNEH